MNSISAYRSLLFLLFLLYLPLISFSQEKITIRVANWAGAEEVKLEERIAAEFMKRHPQVQVEIESIPANYKQKILTSIAAGTVADVFLLDSPIIPALLNKGVLIDLNPYLSGEGIDPEDFFPNVLNIFQKGDALYAIPKDFTPIMMYYNKRMFDKNNVPYPSNDWTWDDYLHLAQQLTRDTDGDGAWDQFGTVFRNYFYLWQPWIWMTGGDVMNPAGTSAMGYFNSPETERALQFLIDLRNKYKVAPAHAGSTTGEAEEGAAGGVTGMFYSERLGMIPNGHWWLITLKKYLKSGELDVGVVPLPYPASDQKANVIYAAGWCVPKITPHREWAIKAAAFFSGELASRIRSELAIGIPANKKVAEEQLAKDPYGFEQVFLEEVQYGRQSWGTVIDEFTRIEKITQQAVEQVLVGGRDIHEAFTEAAQEIDEELKRTARFSSQVTELKGSWEILGFLLLITGAALALAAFFYFRHSSREREKLIQGYAFLTPSFIVLLIFIFTPLFFSLYLSFHQWNVVSSNKPFVALDNFSQLFLGMMISLFIAILMNRNIRGINLLRTIFFLPSVASFVAVALVWQWMYHPEFGLLNYLLSFLGIARIGWLTEPSLALLSIMVLSIWMGIGYQMVIFLAGLQSIPEEIYEVSLIEGANAWQRFWYITLPLLKPTTFFVLITSVISSFQVFTLVYVMTQGGPLQSTDVVVFHIYKNAWDYLKMGYASAISWVLFIVIMFITWTQFRFIGKGVDYR
jgi:multiple sugar transport system permease protein